MPQADNKMNEPPLGIGRLELSYHTYKETLTDYILTISQVFGRKNKCSTNQEPSHIQKK